MNRRNFLKTTGMLSLGLTGCANYINKVINERDFQEGAFLLGLSNKVIKSNTKANYILNDKEFYEERKGYGIVLDDYYLTMAHIADFSHGISKMSPFGAYMLLPDEIDFHTEINGKKLETVIHDFDNDISMFKIPKDLDVKKFPLKPKTQVNIGEKVGIIGNPELKGFNYRIRRITDLDGIDCFILGLSNGAYKNSIGTDLYVIPGDSGTPVVSMHDKKIIGLMGLHFGGLSYFQPIKNFLKYMK